MEGQPFVVLVDDAGNHIRPPGGITIIEVAGTAFCRWEEQEPDGGVAEHLLKLHHVRRLARPADTNYTACALE